MEITALIKQGNTTAFTEAFHAMHGRAFSFFMKRTQGNRETAKELTQLTFIKLWNTRATLSDQHPLEKQLFVIARCILIDHLRASASHKPSQNLVELTESTAPQPMQASHAEAFASDDFMQELMEKLPPARKKVIQLKFIYGFSNREIAERLSVSVKTVEDHVTKGLKELRNHPELYIAISLCCLYQAG